MRKKNSWRTKRIWMWPSVIDQTLACVWWCMWTKICYDSCLLALYLFVLVTKMFDGWRLIWHEHNNDWQNNTIVYHWYNTYIHIAVHIYELFIMNSDECSAVMRWEIYKVRNVAKKIINTKIKREQIPFFVATIPRAHTLT